MRELVLARDARDAHDAHDARAAAGDSARKDIRARHNLTPAPSRLAPQSRARAHAGRRNRRHRYRGSRFRARESTPCANGDDENNRHSHRHARDGRARVRMRAADVYVRWNEPDDRIGDTLSRVVDVRRAVLGASIVCAAI